MSALLGLLAALVVFVYPAAVGGHWITSDEYNAAVRACEGHGGLQWANTVVFRRVEFICHDALKP